MTNKYITESIANSKEEAEAVKKAQRSLQPLIIETNKDLTTAGKRTAKIVKSRKSKKLPHAVIAWYVGGRFYRHTVDAKMTNDWLQA